MFQSPNKQNAVRLLFFTIVFVISALTLKGQSTNSSYPTPITSNSIRAAIAARDIGDSRLTRHYFTFMGTNGDLNITIESENLNGDVDVFTANGMKPLSKVSLFDTGSKFVTTTTIFIRKREPLLLRVEARSANDNAGTYRLSFGGGFEAIAETETQIEDPIVKSKKTEEGSLKVSSSGARLEEPKPPVKEVKETKPETVAKEKTTTKGKTTTPKTTATTTKPTIVKNQPKPKPANTNNTNPTTNTETANNTSANKEETTTVANTTATTTTTKKKTAAEIRAENLRKRKEATAKAAEERKKKEAEAKTSAAVPPAPDPMASVRLIVETKDGQKIERTMNEVRSVTVNKGVLVVIFIDGKTERIPMTNVLKMAIEPLQ